MRAVSASPLPVWPVAGLCAWRADEVQLVEFGRNVCQERTHTLADLVGSWCGANRPGVSINPRGSDPRSAPTSYVVIWERR